MGVGVVVVVLVGLGAQKVGRELTRGRALIVRIVPGLLSLSAAVQGAARCSLPAARRDLSPALSPLLDSNAIRPLKGLLKAAPIPTPTHHTHTDSNSPCGSPPL